MIRFEINNLNIENNKNLLIAILEYAKNIYASDIYLKPGSPVFFSSVLSKGVAGAEGFQQRINHNTSVNLLLFQGSIPQKIRITLKDIAKIVAKPVPAKLIYDLLKAIEIDIEKLKREKKGKHFSIEFIVRKGTNEIEHLGLYRFVASVEKGEVILTGRRLFHHIPSPEMIGLPIQLLTKLIKLKRGLVVIAGPTGSGKSTSLASILELYNDARFSDPKVIVSIEKPIEYIHESIYSFFLQKEVGSDIESFVEGVDTALRENPDVIVLGEVRTNEEIEQSLRASETGHLVFITLHTDNAIDAVKRIATVFTGNDEKRIRAMLSSQIQIILVQRLTKTKEGKPILVYEYIDFTHEKAKAWREQIFKGEEERLRDVLMRDPSNLSLQKHLAELVRKGVISEKDALAVAYDPAEFYKYLTKK